MLMEYSIHNINMDSHVFDGMQMDYEWTIHQREMLRGCSQHRRVNPSSFGGQRFKISLW